MYIKRNHMQKYIFDKYDTICVILKLSQKENV